jgi:hypothetical protein
MELSELVREGRVLMIGLIRMEILCGIRDRKRFRVLENHISAFPDTPLDADLFVTAAEYFNICREHGVQGSNTDFVICACSALWEIPVLTRDKDYGRYQRHLPIFLHAPR